MASINIKIVSFNTGGSLNLGGLLSILSDHKPDICLLQEISVNNETMNNLVQNYNYSASVNNDQSVEKTLGTAILWKNYLENVKVNTIELCRLQSVEICGNVFLNVYGPSGNDRKLERNLFYGTDLYYAVRTFSQNLPFIIGDYNCILEDSDTLANPSNKKCAALLDLVSTFEYTDSFKHLHPDKIEFTWHRPHCSPSRLDRLYSPPHLVNYVLEVSHHVSLSDHHLLEVVLNLPNLVLSPPPPHHSSAYWKLNASILNDSDFMSNFIPAWEELNQMKAQYREIADWWDECAKPWMVKFCKNYSTMLTKVRRDTKIFLFANLDGSIKGGKWEDVAFYRGRLRKIMEDEAKGVIVRSRHAQTLSDEKASLFHQNREKKRGAKSRLNS